MNYTKEELVTALELDDLNQDVQDRVVANFLETLELRTGQVIADALDEAQLKKFNEIVDNEGDKAAENWLHQTIPDFDGIEQQQCDILITEFNENSTFGQ